MKDEIKEKWVNALTSGEYTQTTRRLKRPATDKKPDRHCCLGVLCDLYHKDTGAGKWNFDGVFITGPTSRDMTDAFPPNEVLAWAGIDREDASMLVAHNDQTMVMEIVGGALVETDGPKSLPFTKIASLITDYL